ncbi:hypothetical protein GOB94_15490 [Granulicella sp. 5B5]|uniref:outer membrane beta-barrel protein n=1 Tax=Granulicella sp. 5B5 TaxID=1617967 RepID=UPI0015F4BAA9|nr:outer membrane beta-barrel protein [Granulicella sp. 5B5]QMV19925.1 hypothetical protein GOB94_15490 [Granulicella sp. 5B5]
MNARRIIPALLLTLLFGIAMPGLGQHQTSKLDLGVTYIAEKSLKASTDQNFWLNGGSVELGVNLWHGWGVAADIAGSHTGSIGSSGIPLSLVTETFGPRYRWHAEHRISVYGEALVGEANGFRSLFPVTTGTQSDANSLGLQIGGGLDYRLKRSFAVRLMDAAWVRTQLPNATDNVQNTLRLGAGLVIRFGH